VTNEEPNPSSEERCETLILPEILLPGALEPTTADAVERLFGRGYKLTKLRELVQPGEFAANETVDLIGPRGSIAKVRVLGPARRFSQVEISRTESFQLGIDAQVRISGDISGTDGIRVIGPAGSVELKEGLIIARRHIHMTPEDARFFNVSDGDAVRVRTKPPRSAVFEDVLVRVSDEYMLECHIDTDEANACDLKSPAEVFLS